MPKANDDWMKLTALLISLIIVFPVVGYYLFKTIFEVSLILIFGAIFGLIIWFIVKDRL